MLPGLSSNIMCRRDVALAALRITVSCAAGNCRLYSTVLKIAVMHTVSIPYDTPLLRECPGKFRMLSRMFSVA